MKKSIGKGRGSVYTIILKALQSGDKYGYEICKEIEEKSKGSYILKQPSLYSGLKRLESQKDVCSYWGESDIGGRRHYYSLTEKGRERINNTNFSWEDSRDDILTNLFEKSEEEKSIEDLKQNINLINQDIDEIKEINKQIDEQLSNKQTFTKAVTESDNKLNRHNISPLQQDLFSFSGYIDNLANTDNSTKNNLDSFNENTTNEDNLNVESSKTVTNNSLIDSTINVEKGEIENSTPLLQSEAKQDCVKEKLAENLEIETLQNTVQSNKQLTEEKEQNNKETTDIKQDNEQNSTPQSYNIVNSCKAEKSIINIDDYLNSHNGNTIFSEKIEQDKSIITKNDLSSSNEYFKDFTLNEDKEEHSIPTYEDRVDKEYEEYLKMFENEENIQSIKSNNTEQTKSNEQLFTSSNYSNINKSSSQNNPPVINTNNESVINTQTTQNNLNNLNNFSSDINTQNSGVTNFNNQVNSANSINQNCNQIYNQNNQFNSSNETFQTNSTLNNEENTANVYKKTDVDINAIFGDFIKQAPQQDEQPEHYEEIFKEYNQTNFKAQNDLPRIDLSDNINLTLKSNKSSSFSTFKSYHEDEIIQPYRYNQKEENVIKPVQQQSNNIPFDQKFKESEPVYEDYVVRKFSKLSVADIPSRYINLSKLYSLCLSSSFLVMLLVTICINLMVGTIFKLDKIQQFYICFEYIICGLVLTYWICNQLLNKNKRVIYLKHPKMIWLKLILLTLLEILIIAVNLVLGLNAQNMFNYYATLIIPSIYVVWFVILCFIVERLKKTNFLYK